MTCVLCAGYEKRKVEGGRKGRGGGERREEGRGEERKREIM